MARKSKVLWGHTKYKEWEVPIYKVSGVMKHWWAWTDMQPDQGPMKSAEICIQASNFRNPKSLDETLIHEFIHVIERGAGIRNLGHRPDPNDSNCTKSAQVLGEGLAQMLRELRQANLLDKPHSRRKPRK